MVGLVHTRPPTLLLCSLSWNRLVRTNQMFMGVISHAGVPLMVGSLLFVMVYTCACVHVRTKAYVCLFKLIVRITTSGSLFH